MNYALYLHCLFTFLMMNNNKIFPSFSTDGKFYSNLEMDIQVSQVNHYKEVLTSPAGLYIGYALFLIAIHSIQYIQIMRRIAVSITDEKVNLLKKEKCFFDYIPLDSLTERLKEVEQNMKESKIGLFKKALVKQYERIKSSIYRRNISSNPNSQIRGVPFYHIKVTESSLSHPQCASTA